MNAVPPWLSSALALAPAAALWASYPRRSWAAGALSGAALAAGAALVALAPEDGRAAAALTAAWAWAGCGLSWAAARRRERAHEEIEARAAAARTARERAAAELRALKARGLSAEREHREATALYGMVKGLSEALSWEDARPRVEAAVEQFFGPRVEYALFVAGMKSEGEMRPLAGRGLRVSPGSSWATLERLLQEQGGAPASPKVFERPERAVGMPVREGAELLGYLYARVPEDASPETWLAKTQSFVSELPVAFRRVKLFQEVERLSETDGLTGVRRRGAFDRKIADETVRARTFKTGFALMLLDIDHFKSLNDRYGHPFGDQVLARVGAILNASVYDTDFVARYGGEEFAVILPRAEVPGALRRAETIRAAIEAERFAAGFEEVRVTISIGVAHFPRDGAGPEELVARADAALYAAKSAGRNRVIDCEALRRP